MGISKTYLQSIPLMPTPEAQQKVSKSMEQPQNGVSFSEVLNNAEKRVKFSRHAQQRIESRNIKLTEDELNRIDETVDKMFEKGARSSLLYLNNIAFVVSVDNRTVITALDGQNAKENIFTNIDSAAIL